jgi:signal peptidase I
MFGSVERYSSTAGRKRAGLIGGRLLRILIIALILYLIVSRFLFSTFRIESVSMEPNLSPADRVVVSSLAYGPRVPFTTSRLPGPEAPQRGELVVIVPPFLQETTVFSRVLEPFVSFFTGQRVTLHRDLYGSRVNNYMVKRVIGVPGDTVRMSRFVLSIKARGSADFVAEQQLISVKYDIRTSVDARGWQQDFPLSGNSTEIRLGENQYFVLGDNRPSSSDSRSWGPLNRDRIVGKVIYRYWPPRSLGTL